MATNNVTKKTHLTSILSSEDDELIRSTMKKRPRINKDIINASIQKSLTETTSRLTDNPYFSTNIIQTVEVTETTEKTAEPQQETAWIHNTQLETINEDPTVFVEDQRQTTDSPHSSYHSEDKYINIENMYSDEADTGTAVALQSTEAATAIESTHGTNSSNHCCIEKINLEDIVIDTFADYRKSTAPFAEELAKMTEVDRISNWSFQTAAAIGVPPRNVEEPHLKSQQLLMEVYILFNIFTCSLFIFLNFHDLFRLLTIDFLSTAC